VNITLETGNGFAIGFVLSTGLFVVEVPTTESSDSVFVDLGEMGVVDVVGIGVVDVEVGLLLSLSILLRKLKLWTFPLVLLWNCKQPAGALNAESQEICVTWILYFLKARLRLWVSIVAVIPPDPGLTFTYKC